MDTDASLVEINPLNRDSKGNVFALDAQFNFDANALFRPRNRGLRDLDEEDPPKSKPPSSIWPTSRWTATSAAWSTVPAWPWPPWTPSSCSAASRPTSWTWAAAPPEKVTEAFKIMLKNPKSRHLVNIFGGIMKCDTIATGVITACKAVNLKCPGRAYEGHERRTGQEDAGRVRPAHHLADTMAEAATKIVEAVK